MHAFQTCRSALKHCSRFFWARQKRSSEPLGVKVPGKFNENRLLLNEHLIKKTKFLLWPDYSLHFLNSINIYFTTFKLDLECHCICHCNFPSRRTHTKMKSVCLSAWWIFFFFKHVHILENICFTNDFSHPPETHPQLIKMSFLLHDPPDPRAPCIQPPSALSLVYGVNMHDLLVLISSLFTAS